MDFNKPLTMVGFFSESVELAERLGFSITTVVDSNYQKRSNSRVIFHTDDEFINKQILSNVFICPDSPKVRKKLYLKYNKAGYEFSSLICTNASISPSSIIGHGAYIQTGVNISAECILGVCVRVNSFANIMHNAKIGDFVTVAPNAVILGNVKVCEGAYIGANATILPNLCIGANSIIGAGSVVTKDVDEDTVVCGNPARIMR
tara:strand:+ start:1115 stop:1726 length:612 start_codon:yes stop_codon:yes gene_type:complete